MVEWMVPLVVVAVAGLGFVAMRRARLSEARPLEDEVLRKGLLDLCEAAGHPMRDVLVVPQPRPWAGAWRVGSDRLAITSELSFRPMDEARAVVALTLAAPRRLFGPASGNALEAARLVGGSTSLLTSVARVSFHNAEVRGTLRARQGATVKRWLTPLARDVGMPSEELSAIVDHCGG